MQRPKSGASRRHRLALVPGYRPETGQSPSPAQTPRLELYAFAAPASCAEAVTVPPRKPHWRRCRRLKWSLGHWNCRHTVSAARRPGCCAAAGCRRSLDRSRYQIPGAMGCCTKPLARQFCDMIVSAQPCARIDEPRQRFAAASTQPLYLGVYHSNDTSANPRPGESATLYAAMTYA
jgi:hypothetical protein